MNSSQKKMKKKLKREIADLLRKTKVSSNGLDFVNVKSDSTTYELIGCGCSSAVFRSKNYPHVAVKVYSPEQRQEVFLEVVAYKKLQDVSCFPKLYLYGRNFLAIEYIEGKSLYDCLIEGIDIPEYLITQVDEAISIAKERGLVPSDVHFKNIIVNEDRVTLIDLSDYMSAKYVTRWERLKFFYKTVYRPLLRGSRVPKPVVDISRKVYKYLEGLLSKLSG